MTDKMLLLDLDGVLADFSLAACNYHGKDDPYVDVTEQMPRDMGGLLGMSESAFWNGMKGDEEFWANMPMTHEAAQILTFVESLFPKEQISILTAASRDPKSASGKMRWIQKNMPEYDRRFLIGTKHTKHFAALGGILLDDTEGNVDKFREAGGHAVLYPRPWNRNWRLKGDEALAWVKAQISALAKA